MAGRWYCEKQLVRQLPLPFRLWAGYLRLGPKRSKGGTVGGSVIFNLLRRIGGHSGATYYRTVIHPKGRFGLTIDLYDFECFNHTLNLWLYEDSIGRVIRWVLRDGGGFIDAGANYGLYTLTAASECPGFIRVAAVEPQCKVAEALRRSLVANRFDNVVVHEVALGEAGGDGFLYAPETGSGTASMVRENVNSRQPLIELPVRIETLDSIATAAGDPITLIKLDLQGVELNALRGGATALREKRPYVLFEVAPNLHPDRQERNRLFKLLQEAGYRTFVDVSTLIGWDPALEAGEMDVIAVPPHGEAAFETYRQKIWSTA
jgi:FkbM family methyltransferase